MKKQYLHLSAYSCDKCSGPVIAGSLGVRENEISKETDIRQVAEAAWYAAIGKAKPPSQRVPVIVAVRMGCYGSPLAAMTCKRGGAQSCRTMLRSELWTCNPPL